MFRSEKIGLIQALVSGVWGIPVPTEGRLPRPACGERGGVRGKPIRQKNCRVAGQGAKAR
jgi:hypothetical protein